MKWKPRHSNREIGQFTTSPGSSTLDNIKNNICPAIKLNGLDGRKRRNKLTYLLVTSGFCKMKTHRQSCNQTIRHT